MVNGHTVQIKIAHSIPTFRENNNSPITRTWKRTQTFHVYTFAIQGRIWVIHVKRMLWTTTDGNVTLSLSILKGETCFQSKHCRFLCIFTTPANHILIYRTHMKARRDFIVVRDLFTMTGANMSPLQCSKEFCCKFYHVTPLRFWPLLACIPFKHTFYKRK